MPKIAPQVSQLNASQAAAAEALATTVRSAAFSVTMLDGVTGSGKTEVYLEAAAAVLAETDGAQVLIMLPEIALTQAVIDRVATRFGAPPAEWHSGVAPPRRRQVWEDVVHGVATRIVVGARSALFLPFVNLRLIVVDEEHDGSYKQDDGFIYQARDLAVARGKIEAAAVVLASATPSLETLFNAQSGRYRWLKLADRHGAASMPDIALVDMRETPPEPGQWLSPAAGEGGRRDPGSGRTGPAVPQPPRLCAGGAVQGVRRAHEGARQRFLARGASLQRAPGLPSHRIFDAPPGAVSSLRGQRFARIDRTGGWSAWKRRRASGFRTRGWRFSRPTP